MTTRPSLQSTRSRRPSGLVARGVRGGVGVLVAALLGSVGVPAVAPAEASSPGSPAAVSAAALPAPDAAPDTAPDAAPDLTPDAAPSARAGAGLEVGVQFHGTWSSYTDPQRAAVLDRLAAMGSTWVRVDISWAMIQPGRGAIDADGWGVRQVDKVVRMAQRRGLKVLGTFWLTPDWARPSAGERSAPADPATYGRALAWSARKWRGAVQAWEVWNEPNSPDFFAGADPTRYTRLLCAAHRAVRRTAGTSGVAIVYGGTMYNDTDWIARTYRAGAKGCFDVMATHPYTAPSNAGPAARSGSGSGSLWDFTHLVAVRRLMLRHQDRSPIWATEFGWSSHANPRGTEPWNRGVTPQQQARYTVAALSMMKRRFPYVRKAFIYNSRAEAADGAHLAGYGILTATIRPKPVYWALKRWLG